jgi:polysaccharide biosynthesis transport protein
VIATENLNQFMAKKSTLQINYGQQVTPWKNISSLTAPQLISLRSNALLGSVLGLLLGLSSALLLDRLINVFYNADEIKRASKLPTLGIIPYNRELPQLESTVSSLSSPLTNLTSLSSRAIKPTNKPTKFGMMPFLEAFRMLTTNLRLSHAAQPIRSIVITSALPEDGKSTIVTYLAQAAASMGQRVLIVDADLRVPQQHDRLGLSNQQGLSQVLLGNGDVSEFIQPWSLNPNVQVLTAGQIPQDPITLLASEKMHDLMTQVSQRYDLVIYDAPPLCGLSDAHLVAAHSDGLLLVTRVKKTKRDALEQVLEDLRQLPTRVLGIVVNDSRQTSASLHRGYYTMTPIEPFTPPTPPQPTKPTR